MTLGFASIATAVCTRPRGFLQPVHQRAIRAVKALAENRIEDAEANVAAIPETPADSRIWKGFISGQVAVVRGDFGAAEVALVQATALALLLGMPAVGDADEPSPTARPNSPLCGEVGAATSQDTFLNLGPETTRLLAAVVENLGCLYRRQERLNEAFCAHRLALGLRRGSGSYEELWETATSLGLDADVAHSPKESLRWHQMAVDLAERVSEQADQKRALAWQHLSAALIEAGHPQQAVAAAKTARGSWHRHDRGGLAAAKADLILGHALLRYGESLWATDAESASAILGGAIDWLATAHESLAAFGAPAAADAQSCLQLKDFAERLRASVVPANKIA